MDLGRAPAYRLLDGLRQRRLRSIDLVDACYARIREVEPALCAVVAEREAQARLEAQEADRRREAGEEAPLLGLPITVKEFFAVEGMPHTGGLVARQGIVAQRDAAVVARLRAAGAIVLGVTNAPEGGLWAESANKVYGTTNNPWDPTRTSGGSSGGEGAILAAGGSPLGVGSDIGGSVRIPAAFCGVAAHKPTGGLVPKEGHHPTHDADFLCVGPMARSVRDLELALPVMAGTATLGPLRRAGALRVLVVDEGLSACTEEVRPLLAGAARALSDAGARVETVSLPDLRRGFWIWAAAMRASGSATYAEILGGGTPTPVFRELAKATFGASRHTTPPLLVAAAEMLLGQLPLFDDAEELRRRDRLRQALHERLDPDTVLLLPVFPRVAPRHGGYVWRFTDNGWCGVFNILGLPSTAVPAGFAGHLPFGVQLVGGRDHDTTTLSAGVVLEDALDLPPREPPILTGRATSRAGSSLRL